MDILIVGNEVAFDAFAPPGRSFLQQWYFGRVERLGTFDLWNFSACVHPQPFFQRQFQTTQIQIRRGGFRVSAAVAHVDLLVGIHDEIIQGVVSVEIKQADVNAVHPGDAGTNVLLQEFAKF